MKVKIIERLRRAAVDHGEVHDLLLTIRHSILIDGFGNMEFCGDADDIAYIRAALDAADFVEYDSEASNVKKD